MDTAQASSDPTGLLLKEYCPPLDSAIVLAISLDYDSIDDARAVLDTLKTETIVDEADGADLSDWKSNNIFSDEETNTTLTSGSKSEKGDRETSADDPIYPLVMMFPTTAKFTLRHTLQKCAGDVDRAIDELLSLDFLDGEGEGAKGIDGFSQDSMLRSKRRGKKKGKTLSQAGNIWDEIDAANGGTAAPSKWEQMQSEISYLSTKLNVPLAFATSAYHKHGSLSATLVALIETHGEGDIIPEDASHLETINSITTKYPRLQQTHIIGLVKMCKDDIASAFKFAEILHRRQLHKIAVNTTNAGQGARSPTSPSRPRANPWNIVGSPKRTSGSSSPTSPTSPRMSYRTAVLVANEHAIARNEAYNKASAAYRRSKGDPLMGAVAGFYADEGRKHGERLKAVSDIAAEALVNQNSSEYTLDLHGVTVQQAIKITNERVTAWWVKTNSTDSRALIPFHIITGIGSHSKGGESRIGPAVSRMLIKGNWKIEVRPGNVTVLGVQNGAKKR
ncbi:hypothetical protein H072_4046 [Dactylellina haptotyla CBS 200.50]|uniref:Smr domain-containing protein n=1 Tax=Dactylellina haptotyla (strain CBS 200.50) TaxID=1284197 RepID=S8BRB1_DACHA|nr:hypothetical protein H072_4046 [Dactylellina haptotyla CBS 200.50]